MQEKFEQLQAKIRDIIDLGTAGALLGWDQNTYMPPAAAETRGHQMAIISRITHEWVTSDEMGRLLEDLKPYQESLDPDSDEARMIKVAKREYDIATRLPSEFVVEQSQVTTAAFSAWAEARAKSDFKIFEPLLAKVVDLNQRFAAFFPEVDHPYDALLDQFEPGMKTAEVKAIFDDLRPQQVELIQAISEQPQVDDSFLHQPFDEKAQWDFGVEVITQFGYDWQRGRQDKAPHPFTMGLSIDDVRITTRVDPNFFNPMFFGTAHECGHALYNQGHARKYFRTILSDGASLAVHESQSRMYENLVARSYPFWEHFYPRMQEVFPQMNGVSLDQFYKGINKVEPSFIRVEADEATYNLHIMLRLELEIAMLEGKVAVKDLPELWNTKIQEYLGLTPPNDALGVLQDVHWSYGNLGYFSTYALGNLVSAQLWEVITKDLPDIDDQIRAGKFEGLLEWLRKNIHTHGKKYEPQELVQKVTGSKIDPAAYMRYLKNKFGKIYNL